MSFRSIPFETFPPVLDRVILSYAPVTDLTMWRKKTPQPDSFTEAHIQQFCITTHLASLNYETLLNDFKENILPYLPVKNIELKTPDEPPEAVYKCWITAYQESLTKTIINHDNDQKTETSRFMEKCLIHFCRGISDSTSQVNLLVKLLATHGDKAMQRIKILLALTEPSLPCFTFFFSGYASGNHRHHLFIEALLLNAWQKISAEILLSLLPFYLESIKNNLPVEWGKSVIDSLPRKWERMLRGLYEIYPVKTLNYRMHTSLEEALAIAAYCSNPAIIESLAAATTPEQYQTALTSIIKPPEQKEFCYTTHYTQIEDRLSSWSGKRTLRTYSRIENHMDLPHVRSRAEAVYLLYQANPHPKKYSEPMSIELKNYWQSKIRSAELNDLLVIYNQGMNDHYLNSVNSLSQRAYRSIFTSNTAYPQNKKWFIEQLQQKVCELLTTQPFDVQMNEELNKTIFSKVHLSYQVQPFYYEKYQTFLVVSESKLTLTRR